MKNSLRLPGKDIYNFIEASNLKDISVLEASFRKKHPDVSKKPMSKNYFALHLILKGAGKLITSSGEYELKKNDIFVRFPNETITYYDYPDNPFNYIFVTFNGTAVVSCFKRIGITAKNRVFTTDDEITLLFKHLVLISRDYPEINDMISAGYMNLAVNMINDGETSVRKIAAACGYENASYFTKTFKLYYNQRPKDYIDKTLNHLKNLR